jgi:hypothetical protein
LPAEAFQAHDEYAGDAISLPTDELAPREAKSMSDNMVSKEMPTTYHFFGRLIRFLPDKQAGYHILLVPGQQRRLKPKGVHHLLSSNAKFRDITEEAK